MRVKLLTREDAFNFVEFNITGDNENYNKCDSESIYLENIVFNLFTPCFERSNKLFEYYGQTKYNARKIIPLKNELEFNLNELMCITSLQELKNFVKDVFLGSNFIEILNKQDKKLEENWNVYVHNLININEELIIFIEKCIEEDRILWVIGL